MASLMPNSVTIERAICVTFSMSFWAPVVGPREARSAAGQHVERDAFGERLALAVHVEDGAATLEVGVVDDDLTVEATWAQQRGIENVGAVGGRDEDYAGTRVEAIHLHEQLVERLLPLIVTAAESGPAMPPDR